ncbi:MAG: hypothetical protein JRJ12_00405 [Deltaproteobacteria bacterium]|nr:hypothetical protein [Deltaproteobacteria bacterium]MBW2069826.1 hypothetical protein [Deltaproteobacteria bacterium]
MTTDAQKHMVAAILQNNSLWLTLLIGDTAEKIAGKKILVTYGRDTIIETAKALQELWVGL